MRFLPVVLALVLALVPIPTSSQPSSISIKYQSGVGGKITNLCTGFYVTLINVVTAAHCYEAGQDVFVDGRPARVIKSDDAFVLLEVQPGQANVPDLAPQDPKVGEPVAVIGWVSDSIRLVLGRRVAGFEDGDHPILDGPVIPGMSGGPVIDSQGRVVAMTQATNQFVGLTCPVSELKKFLGRK